MSRILVVDDEKNIRLLLRTILEGEGHAVQEAGDGAAALDRLRNAEFDLVMLDLNMPIVDGMTVLEQLATNPPAHVPRVIVLTAYGSVSVAVKATRRGALDFLEKPVTPDEIRQAVRDVLRQPEPAQLDEPRGFDGILGRVRDSLRASDVDNAETLLLKAADLGQNMAGYYNLLGVLYELRGQERLARKMYSKAFGAEPGYAPAEQNLRRIYELSTFGKTAIPVSLGDTAELQAH